MLLGAKLENFYNTMAKQTENVWNYENPNHQFLSPETQFSSPEVAHAPAILNLFAGCYECVREFSRGRVECVTVSTRMCHINWENYNYVERPYSLKSQTENDKETVGITNIILPCLTKIWQNYFSHDQAAFETWLTSLDKNSLYKSLLKAHTAGHL